MVVLRALGLGDLLTAVPALRGLRRRYPDHRVELLTPGILGPLALASGAVDAVVDHHGLDCLPTAAAGAAVAVNLHGRGPQSTRLLAASGPGRLVAFSHPELDETVGATKAPVWCEDEHEVHRWCWLVAAVGATADPADLRLPAPVPRSHQPTEVLVHPGAASPARRWPAERWGQVVAALAHHGHRVLITGGPDEVALARRVADVADAAVGGGAGSSGCRVVAGATDLDGLCRLVAGARLVLCGDTGVAHLATAYAVSSVVLFGPTSPARWGPVTDGPHTVLWAGRTGDPHGTVVDPGLCEIAVDDVLTAANARLARPVPS